MHTSLRFALIAMSLAVACLAGCENDDTPGANSVPNGQTGDAGGNRNDSGPEPGSASLGPGPYTLAYAGTDVGIDMRAVAEGKATFDGLKMTAYEASADERPELGTNQVSDASGNEFVAIGRWAGGKTAGKFYEVNGDGLIDYPANGGFHYAIGKFTDPLPASGSVTYTELAKTVATVSDGSVAPGTASGSLAASFAGDSTKIGFSITLDIPGDATYTIATTGGTGDVSTSEAEVLTGGSVKSAFYANLELSSNGAACEGGCSAGVDGFVAGPNAEHVALVAHVYKGSGGSPKSVAAAILFKSAP